MKPRPAPTKNTQDKGQVRELNIPDLRITLNNGVASLLNCIEIDPLLK